jgi:hypothetical protein
MPTTWVRNRLASASRSCATTRRRGRSREMPEFWKVGGKGPTRVRATHRQRSGTIRRSKRDAGRLRNGSPLSTHDKTKPKRSRGRARLEPKRQAKHEPITDSEMAELCPTHRERTRMGSTSGCTPFIDNEKSCFRRLARTFLDSSSAATEAQESPPSLMAPNHHGTTEGVDLAPRQACRRFQPRAICSQRSEGHKQGDYVLLVPVRCPLRTPARCFG